MEHEDVLSEIQKEWHGSVSAYIVGFTLCILLTAASFSLVLFDIDRPLLIFTLVTLAIVQAAVQLVCFLHLGQEEKPRWETMVFGFMVMVVLIIAMGSLWIMYDLNNRVMVGMTS